MGYKYNPFTGELDRVDTTGQPTENRFPITPYVVGPSNQAGYQTIQSAINAATASAESSNVIWIQPGSYTEDLNITSSITFMSIDGVASIIGIHTPPSSGTVTFDGCLLISATDILNSSAAGTTVFNINDSFIIITDGYIFNLPNWTGELLMDNCGEASTEDGVVNNITGSSSIKFLNVEMGAGSKTMELNGDAAGFLRFDTCNVNCPVNMVGDGDLFFQNGVKFANTVTIGGTLSGFAIDTNFRGGSSQALTFNSSGAFSISNGEIQSTNNPAIGGTGSGTLTLTSVAFPDDNNLAGTLTVAGGNQYSATYKSDYTNGGVILGQGALSNMVATTAGTNGQLLIGGTGSDPAFSSLTSTGGSITFTPGVNSLNLETSGVGATSWTPELEFGEANTGITYTSRTGSYQRIGNIAFITMVFQLSSVGSATGAATVTGFPLTFLTGGPNQNFCVGEWNVFSFTAGHTQLFCNCLAGTSTIRLFECGDNLSFISSTDANYSINSSVSINMWMAVD